MTTVNNAIVCFNNGYNGGNGPNNILPTMGVLNLVNNGWFDLNNGTSSQTIAGLTGESTGRLATTSTSHGETLTIDPAAGQSYTFAGVVGAQTILGKVGNDSTLSLTIDGPGTEVLTGANTFTGGTTVSAGTLTLAGNAVSTGGMTVGNVASTTATLNIEGNLPFSGNEFRVGDTASGARGVVNQSAGLVSFTSGDALLIGHGTAGVSGAYNLSGGTLASFSSTLRGVMLGVNDGILGNPISAQFTLSGSGYLDIPNGMLAVGRYDLASNYTADSFMQTGGTATVGTLAIGGISNNVTATFSVSGGNFSAASFPALSAGTSTVSTITIGGTAQVTLPAFPATLARVPRPQCTSMAAHSLLRPPARTTSVASRWLTFLPAGDFQCSGRE